MALVAVAAIVGPVLEHGGSQLFVNAAPLIGDRKPHVGIGSPFAVAFAAAAIVFSPRLVRRMRWRPLLVISWLAAVGWTASLALIDGWQRGWVDRLANSNEYLHDLPRIGSIGSFLSTFTSHIKDFQPGSWTTHVAGHPPAATLVFLLLDRIGLSGGAWAGVLVVGVGALAAVAVPVVLGAPRAARAVLPFTVFFPGAVWVGVSADGLFAGVAATGLAVALVGVLSRRRFGGVAAVAGGLLLGLTAHLSYGLVLLVVIVVAAWVCSAGVLATRGRWVRPWLIGWSSVCSLSWRCSRWPVFPGSRGWPNSMFATTRGSPRCGPTAISCGPTLPLWRCPPGRSRLQVWPGLSRCSGTRPAAARRTAGCGCDS